MKIIIIGNGILSLTTAYRLISKDKNVNIEIIGPNLRPGSASLAAAAMFNSFCELEPGTLENKIENKKWLFNKANNILWPSFLSEIEENSKSKLNYGFGTYLINNTSADFIEDENYQAIINGLNYFNEDYESINPKEIPYYNPEARNRSNKGVFIKNEGWVNPFNLIKAFDTILKKSNQVKFINKSCFKLNKKNGKIISIQTENKEIIYGDKFFLAPGANFTKIIDESNLDISMPKIFYGIGCTVVLDTTDKTLSNCIRTPNRGLACGTYSAPQESNKTVIGASNNVLPFPENSPRVTSVYALLKNAMEQINKDYFRAKLLETNVGWRPTSEDSVPLIGETSLRNLYIATGTKRDGLHCSPLISDIISDLILTDKTKEDIDLFKPERPLHRVYTREESISKYVKQTIDAHYQHDFIPSKDNVRISLEKYYEEYAKKLHDQVGAFDWGIPLELYNIYYYGNAN